MGFVYGYNNGAQLAATVVGIILVYRTLQATHAAVDQAEAATKAANAAVKVTEESAENQLRAYVFAKEATVVKDGYYQDLVVELVVRNFGQTPAKAVRVRARLALLPDGQIDMIANHDLGDPVFDGEIPPNGECRIELRDDPFQQGRFIAMQHIRHAVYLHGVLVYTDVFEQYMSRPFRYEHVGKVDKPTSMKLCMRGNG